MVSIESAPQRLEKAYSKLFSTNFKIFLQEIFNEFDGPIDKILLQREQRKLEIKQGNWQPKFINKKTDLNWKISPLPEKVRNRKLDLGDISPANTTSFIDALYADVQGIQVDFDDGHCPTWRNTIQGHFNIFQAISGKLEGAPSNMETAPILMLRPRAFNMIEHHCMINGKEISAPLFDFALLIYHNGKKMSEMGVGPFFYLSKIENSEETELWNNIFIWAQRKLEIPYGTIKVCVLIENILASFCMEDILYSIRDHAIGLNCGIWDYAASIISKFGDNPNCLIPDRNKYVNMSQPFLEKYMRLVINTCHRRGALATGGMAAQMLPPGKSDQQTVSKITDLVKNGKRIEILKGVDGFMVHDIRLVQPMIDLWKDHCTNDNQMNVIPDISDIEPPCLIKIPKGGVTFNCLRHNITVALLFIYHWLSGSGIFFYNGAVEDSATAEISRSQLWQWIRHSAPMEDGPVKNVTRQVVYTEMDLIIQQLMKNLATNNPNRKKLLSSKYILLEIISSKNFIEYLTTFLNDNHKFRALHNKSDGLTSKL